MARFVVTGELRPAVTVTWNDGELGGSPSALAEVALLVDLGEQVAATPTGHSYTAALEPDYVAVATIAEALDRVDEGRRRGPARPEGLAPAGGEGLTARPRSASNGCHLLHAPAQREAARG